MHLRNSLECHLQNTKQKKGNKFVKHQEKNKRDNCIYKTFGKTAQYSGDDLYFVYDPFHLQYVISWRHALPAVFKQGGDDDDREHRAAFKSDRHQSGGLSQKYASYFGYHVLQCHQE